MLKRLLSILILVGVLLAFVFPGGTYAAPPKWWQIVKADAIGALDGYLGSGTVGGAIIGGVKGSLEASITEGAGGGSWNTDAAAKAGVGLHHNLALNHIYQNMKFQGEVLTDAERKMVLELLNQYMIRNNLEIDGITGEYLSPQMVEKGLALKLQSAVREGRISAEFSAALRQAIELLDSDFESPRAYIDRVTPLLYQDRFTGKEDRIIAKIYLDVISYSNAYWEHAASSGTDTEEPVREGKKLVLRIDKNQAAVNEASMILDVPPFIRDGRTLIPFRFIGEQLGASIGWNASTRAVTYVTADTEITLFIGSTTAIINGVETALDTPPIIVNSRTVVPVRFISESLGFTVDWKADLREIIIKGK